MESSLKQRISREAPNLPGIYEFLNRENVVIYVGKSKDLKNRLVSYTAPISSLSPKTARMVSEAQLLKFQTVQSELEALLLEAKLIKEKQPRYNSIARDDKHPLYIKITNEEFPKILTVRREDDRKSTYFGPFPSSLTIRSVLRHLRTIFPYCSQTKFTKRPCFYSHLGLCDPCPSEIVSLPPDQRAKRKRDYRLNIKRIKNILEGKISLITSELEKAMESYAKNEDFENAAHVRDQITNLRYIIQRPSTPESIISNPNLPEDKALLRQKELLKILQKHLPNLTTLHVIETYDIANIQGKSAVGSQVTFVDGVPEKSLYKKYLIRLRNTPNDVGMIKEVLGRRLSHQEWDLPELIVVDGGKPQVGAAGEVLSAMNLQTPLIGLAKREEEIIIPKSGSFITLKIDRSNPGLQLLQHIRDEAHRFAQSYHHLLMKKRLKEIDIPI